MLHAAPTNPRITLLAYSAENLFDVEAAGGEYPAFRDASLWDQAPCHRKLAVRRVGLLQVDDAADPLTAPSAPSSLPPLRPILELELQLPGGESLALFNAYCKSKRRGESAAAALSPKCCAAVS